MTNHAPWGLMCEICFNDPEPLTAENAAVDASGQKWDVHAGECARRAGLVDGVWVSAQATAEGGQ